MATTVVNLNDAMIDSGNTTTGFATDTSSVIGFTSSGSIKRRLLLKFDPDDVPAGNVTVEIGFRPDALGGSARSFDVHLLDNSTTQNFSEEASGASATANWTNYQAASAWGTAGGDFLSSPKVTLDITGITLGDYTYYNITDLWTHWQGLSLTYFALLVKATTEASTTGTMTLAMREGGSDGTVLRITQLPPIGQRWCEMNGNIYFGT